MAGSKEGGDKDYLFKYLTGEITFQEWNELKKAKPQVEESVSEDAEAVTISLKELTVISRDDGSTILTTGAEPAGQVASLKGPVSDGAPTVIAMAPRDGGMATLLDPVSEAPALQPSAILASTSGLPDNPKQVKLRDEQLMQEENEVILESDDEAESFQVPTIKEEPCDNMETDKEEDGDVIIIDSETTMRYLTGEMPFEEYSRFLDMHIKEEPENSDNLVVENVALDMELRTSEEPILPPSREHPPTDESTREGLQSPKPQTGRRVKQRKTRLPRHLQGLMGEANMKFARGEHEEAIKMCMEIIRLAPTAHEPFQTLGMLYDEKGDIDKALQFLLIAAHLNPSDSEEWARLAEMSLEQSNIVQAISCYDKAIKYDSTNVTWLWARCDLHEQQGDMNKALSGYQQILKLLTDQDAEKYFQLARDVTKSYHKLDQPDKAIANMEDAFKKHPELVSAEDVNMLLELYLLTHNYWKPLEVLTQHCGLRLHLVGGQVIAANDSGQVELPEDMNEPVEALIPDEFPIDLRVKLVICLIHLRFLACHQAIVDPILLESPEEVGDLYLDVAEAYMECGDYSQARPFLHMLVHSEKYNLAAVWLRYGECLNALGEVRAAAGAYGKVVELAPSHLEARVLLSALRQQLGEHEEALKVLDNKSQPSGDSTSTSIDLRLMLPRCNLLYSQGKIDDFIECAIQVLFGHFRDIFKKSHLSVILGNRSVKHRIYALRCVLGSSLDQRIKDASSMLLDNTVAVEDLWELYMKLGRVLVEHRRFSELMELSITALMSPLFMNDPHRALETDFICLTACLLNRTSHFAYNFIREICVKQLNNNRAWNLFTQIISMSQDIRHNRYCLRLIIKHPEHHALGILNGHNAMVAGSYKHALGEYVCAFRRDSTDPLILLCIGNTFIHMACQKFSTCRHSLIIQGCAFLNQYMEVRGECQETYYNMGRALHQIGLLSAAIYCYEKALECGPAIDDDPELFDLSREIAFNLALIYQSSNSQHLAAAVLQRYLVI